MERVTGSEDIASICEGLASPYRAEIFKLVVTHGEMTYRELIDALRERGYGETTYSLISHHATIMALEGLVELGHHRVHSVRPVYRVDIYREKI